MSPEERIACVRNSLEEFEKRVEPLLDIPIKYFDRPEHTLRDALAHCEEALEVNWRDHDQSAVATELASTFGQVAHNLPPRALKEAIEWMHFANQDLLLLRERG